MRLLSIETSCDETAMSLVEVNERRDNFRVLSDITISQIDIHREYGGVFPALAKREHAKNLIPLLKATVDRSGTKTEVRKLRKEEEEKVQKILSREKNLAEEFISYLSENGIPHFDAVSVTIGPGLAPALWTGVNFARALSLVSGARLYPANHMEGHIASILLKPRYLEEEEALFLLDTFPFPMVALLISGGHTQLVHVRDWGEYELVGETLDDAVGEAFDKVARMLGLPYPGGPEISRIAKEGKIREDIHFPRPMIHSGDFRFSFSGLKTSVRYLIRYFEKAGKLDEQTKRDIALAFEEAVRDVLLAKTAKALDEYGARGLIVAGGVSANERIAQAFREETEKRGIPLYLPERYLCGDNALMIAASALLKIRKGDEGIPPGTEMRAVGNLHF